MYSIENKLKVTMKYFAEMSVSIFWKTNCPSMWTQNYNI